MNYQPAFFVLWLLRVLALPSDAAANGKNRTKQGT
jgi:hypothetical protein